MNLLEYIINRIQTIPVSLPDSIPDVKEEVSMLKSLPFDELVDRFIHSLVTFTINLVIAIIVFYVGKYIIGKIYNLVRRIMIRRKVDTSLATFLLSFVRIVLYFVLIVTVVGILGIETTSFLAIFASAGVAIGMALSGTLQNFAGGVLILLLKPYKVGDYIEAQGFAGTVREIQIFHTIISTYDNKAIIIPNGGLSTGSVNNWSREDYRRIDWTVSISYGDSIDEARKAILEIIKADERVVKTTVEADREERKNRGEVNPGQANAEELEAADSVDISESTEKKHGWIWRLFHRHRAKVEAWQEKRDNELKALITPKDCSPTVVVDSLGASSVNLKARAWARTDDYWQVYYSINEQIYTRLPRTGISFPFPQLDVHLDASLKEQIIKSHPHIK